MAAPDLSLWAIIGALRQQAVAGGELDALPTPVREARLFAAALEGLPLGIEPGDTLAGDFGSRYLSEAQRGEIEATLAAPIQAPSEPAPPSPLQLMTERFYYRAGYTKSHTCADYEGVIRAGLAGFLDDVADVAADATGDALDTLQAMAIALKAVAAWAGRYADVARAHAESAPDAEERERLELIAEACDHVPMHPARTFHEALQAVWLIHAAIGVSELSGSSLSLGRLDQFLLPLFQRDLDRGIPLEELERHLHSLWRKLNAFGDPACAVNLGGLDPAGRDLFNPLSAMIVRVTRDLRLPAPILAARIHERLPTAVFDSLTAPDLFTLGQPTFYGELPCREAMVRRGVPASEAHRFALNSCMGLVMPGEEISDMWGGVANLLLPLELTLNGGEPFDNELPIKLHTPPLAEFADFDALYAQFEEYLDELIAYVIGENWKATQYAATHQPNPFLSALTRDCIARGEDRAGGGARYHCIIIEGFGWANAADALTAIRQLVFETGSYSLGDLVAAVKSNFDGDQALRCELLACPKYGNGDDIADDMARRVTDTFARLVSQHDRDNVHYLPSYHTLNAHVVAGKASAASLDGRRRGEALGKNAGPMLGRNTQGLTGALLSASAIDQRAMSGGQALDISLDPALVEDSEGRRKFQEALLTYFARGGLQVQVNGISACQLREAIADPRQYADLTVKIAGYSARFVSLPSEIQEEMVERFETGL